MSKPCPLACQSFVLLLFLALTLSAPASARAAAPPAPGENEVRGFVYAWFALFDRFAPEGEFLARLADRGLEMRFPEATLRSHADFRRWYAGVRKAIATATHGIERLRVVPMDKDRYDVEVVVDWRATTTAGAKTGFVAHQTWEVARGRDGALRILRYEVTSASGSRNALKHRILGRGKPAFGGFVTMADPKVVENLAVPGELHFVWIEAEHSDFGPTEVQDLVRAAENEGLVPLVRVPRNDADDLKKYVGVGVGGVIVPSIRTADDARRAVAALKFPPAGQRPAGADRSNRYLARFAETLATANDDVLVVLMLETKEAVANIEEILAVPGVDVVHMGPYDLSLSMGVSMSSDELSRAVATVEAAARRRGIPLGGALPSLRSLDERVAKGYRLFTVPGDMQLLQDGIRRYFADR